MLKCCMCGEPATTQTPRYQKSAPFRIEKQGHIKPYCDTCWKSYQAWWKLETKRFRQIELAYMDRMSGLTDSGAYVAW